MLFNKYKREAKPTEKIVGVHRFVLGGCMNDVLGDCMISDNNAIRTTTPEVGDYGLIATEVDDSGNVCGRLAIFGGIEESTGRGLVLTSNRGFGHRRKQGIDVAIQGVGEMEVIGTLTSESMKKLKHDINHGSDPNRNDPL